MKVFFTSPQSSRCHLNHHISLIGQRTTIPIWCPRRSHSRSIETRLTPTTFLEAVVVGCVSLAHPRITIETVIVASFIVIRKRLLKQNLVRSVGQAKGTESVNEVRKLYLEIVLKAVAERVAKGVGIAERTDITARQVRGAWHFRHNCRPGACLAISSRT